MQTGPKRSDTTQSAVMAVRGNIRKMEFSRLNRKIEIARMIVDQAADSGIKLVASLPDNWLADVIRTFDDDDRFHHVPVNREESAVGLCAGAFLGGLGSVAVMGASGMMTLVYAITKINYTYEIPVFFLITLRGSPGDRHKHHASNGLYLLPVMDAINLPYRIVDSAESISQLATMYSHSRIYSRPAALVLTGELLRGAR